MSLSEQQQKFNVYLARLSWKKQYFMKIILLQDIWKESIKSGLLIILHIFKVMYLM